MFHDVLWCGTSHEMLDLFISVHIFFMMWSFNLVTDIAEVTGTWPWIQSRRQRKCEGLQWFTRSFSLDSVGYAFWCVSDDKKMSAGSTHQSSPAQPEGLEGQEESIETENADLSKGWQSGFEQKFSGLPWQTQTCWMEGLHAINKAEQGCCALDRGGDFAFAFDRSDCA